MKMEPIESSETSVFKTQTPGKNPKENIIQEITKIPGWPRRKAVAEFRLCVGHDYCPGTNTFTALDSGPTPTAC